MVSRFKKDDKVVYGVNGAEVRVEHSYTDADDREWLWLVSYDSPGGVLRAADYCTKVEPFWEAGKTYRSTDQDYHPSRRWYCHAVHEIDGRKYAVVEFTPAPGSFFAGDRVTTWTIFGGTFKVCES